MRKRPLILMISFLVIEESAIIVIIFLVNIRFEYALLSCKDIFFLGSFIIIRYFCLLEFLKSIRLWEHIDASS